ncbi:MAG TPA: hypothetical protein VKT32_06895 [Chthonomonadaceae bacterium]|nr:hypothetical protein [Chthonomonadaceae bacterium]
MIQKLPSFLSSIRLRCFSREAPRLGGRAARSAFLWPVAALLLVALLFLITDGQIARAEQALALYRQEAAQYRQTARSYETFLERQEMPAAHKSLRALLEQQAAGYSYD